MAYPAALQIDYAAPYETTTTQLYPIGQKAEDTDGSVFRYTLMGAATGIANSLYQSAIPTANWVTQTHTVEATAGDTSLSFDDGGTAFTVNQAAGGTVEALADEFPDRRLWLANRNLVRNVCQSIRLLFTDQEVAQLPVDIRLLLSW